MGKVAREAGQRAFSWVDEKNGKVKFQSFVFDNVGAAVRFKPKAVRVAEVVFDGEKWVENKEGK